jgi:uncharacterized protein YkwD
MQSGRMTSIALFFSFFAASANNVFATANDPGPVVKGSKINKTVLLQIVNEVRKKGCQCGDQWYPSAPPVVWNDQLENAAVQHSTDMYQKKYFSHTSQDGTNAGVRIDAVGYRWKTYGENIAMGYRNEKEVVEGWVKSPGHCRNIMNKDFKEMGVAKAGSYWTQDFGTKR